MDNQQERPKGIIGKPGVSGSGKVAPPETSIFTMELTTPKCFGHYMNYPTCEGHHTCKVEGPCFSERSANGPCDCPHKRSCHIPRQWLQSNFKKENPKHVCTFLKYFNDGGSTE